MTDGAFNPIERGGLVGYVQCTSLGVVKEPPTDPISLPERKRSSAAIGLATQEYLCPVNFFIFRCPRGLRNVRIASGNFEVMGLLISTDGVKLSWFVQVIDATTLVLPCTQNDVRTESIA